MSKLGKIRNTERPIWRGETGKVIAAVLRASTIDFVMAVKAQVVVVVAENLTIIWLSPNIVFALTPPAPVDPVLPNFDHVRICCSGWPGGGIRLDFTSVFPKKKKTTKV